MTITNERSAFQIIDSPPPAIINCENQKGFFSIVKPLFEYYSHIFRATEWQYSHKMRESQVSSLPILFRLPVLRAMNFAYLQQNICTFSAINLFSSCAEIIGDTKLNCKEWEYQVNAGVDRLETMVKNRQSEFKGTLVLCRLRQGNFYIHDYVVDFTPSSSCYIYQSYINHYHFYQGLTFPQRGPWETDELMLNLKKITDLTASESEKKEVYYRLFHVNRSKLNQLELNFWTLPYEQHQIPKHFSVKKMNSSSMWYARIQSNFYSLIQRVHQVFDTVVDHLKRLISCYRIKKASQ